MKKTFLSKLTLTLFSTNLFFLLSPQVDACTRVVYKGPENTVITARSMDWKDEIDANIWVFPRGLDRSGNVGNASEKWTSKYGSVIASAWDIATTDGMNEKGLVANVSWLVVSIRNLIQKEQNQVLPLQLGHNMF